LLLHTRTASHSGDQRYSRYCAAQKRMRGHSALHTASIRQTIPGRNDAWPVHQSCRHADTGACTGQHGVKHTGVTVPAARFGMSCQQHEHRAAPPLSLALSVQHLLFGDPLLGRQGDQIGAASGNGQARSDRNRHSAALGTCRLLGHWWGEWSASKIGYSETQCNLDMPACA
jgi:hypothetical protein